MLKFERSFNSIVVRMVRKGQSVYYSAYDVAKALNIKEKRRAVNEAVITEAGSFMELVYDESGKALFLSSEYAIALAWKADWTTGKQFIKWMLETIKVAERMEQGSYESIVYSDGFFATTQVAKKYGMSARKLNDILSTNGIQYKVNDQWVLYNVFEDKNYTKTVKIQKPNNDEYVFHTYWTVEGVVFIEALMDRLGYKQQGEQLKLF